MQKISLLNVVMVSYLLKMAFTLIGTANRILAHKLGKEDNQCLTDLRLTDPTADKARIEGTKDQLLKDSYTWILSHQGFTDWRDDDKTQLLWIKGDPGKGKTMLLIAIIKELSQYFESTADFSILSYFFCQATDSRLNNATAVLRGLIYLLLVQQRSLITHLRKKYDHAGRRLFEDANAFYALSEIFRDMLLDMRLKRAYLIIDALDECETGLSKLLELIIRETSTSSSRVKWLVSSRNKPEIEEWLGLADSRIKISLELNAASVLGAVDAYINHKVSYLTKLKGYDRRLQDDIRSYLRAKADGTFLWAALVCKRLEETHHQKTLSVLKAFPSGLEPLYKRMIDFMHDLEDDDDIEFCKQILALMTVAYRPIHLRELISTVGLLGDWSDNLHSLEKLVELCGSFLIVRDAVIYFVHQSAKDYLITNAAHLIFPDGRAKVNYGILSRSLQVMSQTLRRDIYDLCAPGILIDQVGSADPDPLAPVRYSCVYWVDHLHETDGSSHYEGELRDGGTIHMFLQKHFLHWMEALSLMRSMLNGVAMVGKLEHLHRVSF